MPFLKQVSRFIFLSLNRRAQDNMAAKFQPGSTAAPNYPWNVEIIHHLRGTDPICTPDWGHPSPGPREPLHHGWTILKETCWKHVKGRLPGFLDHDNRGPWASTCLSKAPRKSHFCSNLSILYQMQGWNQIKVRKLAMPANTNTAGWGYMCLDIFKGMKGDKQIGP